MSSGCGDVLSLADLQTAKKHQLFEAEVITGKQGGVASGADIDYATNQATGQTQKTLPAVLRDAGFSPASFDFSTGGTLGVNDRDKAVLWPISGGGDGNYYVWKGALPKTIPAASSPGSTGGISPSAWVAVSEAALRSDLASPNDELGDALVEVKQRPTAKSMSQNDKNFQSLNLADYAGAPDGSTDCWAAVLDIKGANANPIVRCPFIFGSANTYYFSNFDPSMLYGVTFDVDNGVTLSVPDDRIVGSPSAVYLKFSNPTNFAFRNISTQYTVMPSGNSVYASKDTFLESESYDYSTVSPIICNTQLTPLTAVFGSDTWTSGSFASVDASSAYYTLASGDNKLNFGAYNVKPGDKISASLLVNGAPYILAVVRTSGGYYVLKALAAQDGSGLTILTKYSGINATEVAVTTPMQGNHTSYSGVNSEWAIKINSYTNFDISFNGFVVISINTTGFITDAGFGGMFQVGLSNGGLNIYNPVVTKDSKTNASKFLAVKVFGDSVSSQRYDCWPVYLKKELEYSSGLRAWNIINSAVAGQDSSQQLSIMQSVGISDANLVVIAIGTNDAQGQESTATYKSNLNKMIDICVNAGKPVLLCKFGLWYTQAQAGARGQASASYDRGAQYRTIAARVAAERGIKLLDLTEIEGPIVGFYVNPAAPLNMVGYGDPTVHDNIHPTTMTEKLIARNVAKAIMGMSVRRNTFLVSNALIATAGNGWQINANDNPLFFDISHEGVLTAGGLIFKSSGSTVDGTTIFVIPKSMAPKGNITVNAASDQPASIKLVIGTDGTAKIYGWSSANFVSLGGLSWSVK